MRKFLIGLLSILILFGVSTPVAFAATDEAVPTEEVVPTPDITPSEEAVEPTETTLPDAPVVPPVEEPNLDDEKEEGNKLEFLERIATWIINHKDEVKALFGVGVGVGSATIITLIGFLIKGILQLILRNRREERESEAQREAVDRIVNAGEAILEKINEANKANNEQVIKYINTLDTTKRKEALEAGETLKNQLDDITKNIVLDNEE